MHIFKALIAAVTLPLAAAQYGFSGDPFQPGPNARQVRFNSSGTEIVGYHYAPAQGGSNPVVLIAHGLGGLQTSRLQPFAQSFAKAGYHALTFDYRYWGQSKGKPRNIIDVKSQQDDYRAAAKAASSFPGVDPNRIVLWGTSLSGGHVLSLGGDQLENVVAVIAQAPHVNGAATVGALPQDTVPGLTTIGIADAANALLPTPPIYIPLANKTGEYGALTQQGALEGYEFVQPTSPAPGNVFAARFIIQLPFYNPDSTAAKSKVPTFIGVGTTDNIVTAPPAEKLATEMKAELKRYDGGHFSVYPGAERYEAILADQLAFLQQHVPL